MYQVIKIYVRAWERMLVYRRLINATVLYLLTTVLYFYTVHLEFYGRYSAVFAFDPPMQSTIKDIIVLCVGGSKTITALYLP